MMYEVVPDKYIVRGGQALEEKPYKYVVRGGLLNHARIY